MFNDKNRGRESLTLTVVMKDLPCHQRIYVVFFQRMSQDASGEFHGSVEL